MTTWYQQLRDMASIGTSGGSGDVPAWKTADPEFGTMTLSLKMESKLSQQGYILGNPTELSWVPLGQYLPQS